MLDDEKHDFQEAVWAYYQAHGRHDLPWRQLPADGTAAYEIMVSELMLQQTQVSRVFPLYQRFLALFPTVQDLAAAPLGEVLKAWSGLGYNRRAKFLHQAAGQVTEQYGCHFPAQAAALVALPGIGPNTAGAILAYAFNQPAVFVETNLRTVYIHHFFADQQAIADKAILELVASTLNLEHPREWYWALMDYGSHLKQTQGNLNRQSQTYARQSPFAGSRRQIRGQIIRLLGERPLTKQALEHQITDSRLTVVLDELLSEGLIRRQGRSYQL